MKLSVKLHPFSLALKYPFTISRYTIERQDTLIVSISDGENIGYGEAAANPYYGSSLEKLKKSVTKVSSLVENAEVMHPVELWQILSPQLWDDYFALCAIDCAFWDLYGKKNKLKLHELFSEGIDKKTQSSYTIGIDTIDKMKSKIEEISWPIYKIKLGTGYDLKIMEEMRKSTNSILRIDANCAWSIEQTIEFSRNLKEIDVEFIEQPLVSENWDGMKQVYKESVLPLIADESCQKYEDVEKCIGHFHGINIKLMKCGGLTPALRMIKKARDLNLKIMAGCMTESTVGISNILQLSPLLDYLDADGALLLKEDVATGAFLDSGNVIFSTKNGSGIDLLAENPILKN